MKAVKIIAALLAALLLTGCSVKITVGTQDENQPAETAKQTVTVEDIGALVNELQNGTFGWHAPKASCTACA